MSFAKMIKKDAIVVGNHIHTRLYNAMLLMLLSRFTLCQTELMFVSIPEMLLGISGSGVKIVRIFCKMKVLLENIINLIQPFNSHPLEASLRPIIFINHKSWNAHHRRQCQHPSEWHRPIGILVLFAQHLATVQN